MISCLVKQHIKKKAKKNNLTCPERLEEILMKEIQEYTKSKLVLYSWLWDGGGRSPNASATIPGVIFVNAEWAARIALYAEDEDMHSAFRLTIGHEITHQENDYFILEPFTKKEKFVYWVNEVHADFGGIVKAFDGSIELGLRAMEYKVRNRNRVDRDSYTHPSWERRMKYVRGGNFDARLIREIAETVGCKNEGTINRVINHFEVITLN